MSSHVQKRKHKTLTIKQKSDILDRLNRNETFSSLASAYGVGRSTIYDIKMKQEKIKTFVSTTDYGPEKRKTLKKAEHPEVEEALYTWFLQEKNRHTHISGPMLAMKAKFFYKEITKKDDFVASKGWLERFKKRHGIGLAAVTRNKVSDDITCIEQFNLRFLQKVKNLDLSPSQVYIAIKSGLFWRVIPNETHCLSSDNFASGRKMSKERVTILLCANAAGTHALKMSIIGKTNEPRVFKNIDVPVHYYRHKGACITKGIFKKWFDKCFVPEVKTWLKDHNLPQKALLLLENADDHLTAEELTTEDKCITAMFLPPTCTELIQPINQNIIQFVKKDYKKNLLLRAVSMDQPIEETLKELNMKDLVFDLYQSWNALSPSTISSSLKKLWSAIITTHNNDLQVIVPTEVIEKIAAETHISSEDLKIWCQGTDKEENISYDFSDEEAINQVTICTTIKRDNDVISTTKQVSTQDTVKAFELGVHWAEENGVTFNELLTLRRLRDKALFSSMNNLKH